MNNHPSSARFWTGALAVGVVLGTFAAILLVGAAATPDWRLW